MTRPFPLGVVAVTGGSMRPSLREGDFLLVRRCPDARPGAVVVARFRSRPDLLVLKRAVGRSGDGWWVLGDAPDASDDSRTYGVADIRAVVLGRYWPRPRRRF